MNKQSKKLVAQCINHFMILHILPEQQMRAEKKTENQIVQESERLSSRLLNS